MSGGGPFTVPAPPGPLVDADRKITRSWWWFFFQMWNLLGKGTAPPLNDIATVAFSSIKTTPDHSGEIRALQAITLSSARHERDDLERRIKALEDVVYGTRVHPPSRPELDMVVALTLGTHS